MVMIRPYDATRDAAACLAIWRSASEVGHPFLDRATLDADADLVRDVYLPAAEVHVATLAEAPVGFVALLDRMIGALFVDPRHHGTGIGRALVGHAAALRGSLDVEVYEANTAARAFYAACGFVETGRRDTDDHGLALPLVRMHRG